MTITTLILILATGIVAVTVAYDCPSVSPSNISSCCELVSLKQFFTFSKNVQNGSSGVYQLNKFCRNDCIQAEAYCDTSNGGGG